MANKASGAKKEAKRPRRKVEQAVKDEVEKAGRARLVEELFYDLYESRRYIYLMNFVRGLFFGLGSVLGATLLVALAIWLLGQFSDIFPPLADFINNLTDTMQQRR